VEKMMVISNSF